MKAAKACQGCLFFPAIVGIYGKWDADAAFPHLPLLWRPFERKHSTRNIRELALNSLASTFTTNPKKTTRKILDVKESFVEKGEKGILQSLPHSHKPLSPSLLFRGGKNQFRARKRRRRGRGMRTGRWCLSTARKQYIAQDDSGSEGKCEVRGRNEGEDGISPQNALFPSAAVVSPLDAERGLRI